MGGSCVKANYLKKFTFGQEDSNISIENDYDKNHQNEICKITNKSFQIISNTIGNSQERRGINKRYSEFHNLERKYFENSSKIKNIGNKIPNMDRKDVPYNETFIKNKPNFKEETIKKINSNYNSSNFNGSTIFPITTLNHRTNGIMEEEENNEKINNNSYNYNQTLNNINNENSFHDSNYKHFSDIKKIEENENEIKKVESTINNNLDENTFILINKNRGNYFLNSNEIEKFESPTPKLMIERDNLDKIAKGNTKIFSHFYKNKINGKATKNQFNNFPIIKEVFTQTIYMNKYNEEMLNIINSIRTNPINFIKDIDYLINNNIQKTEEGIFIISQDVEEKIKLMDNYLEIFEQIKNNFKKTTNLNTKLEKMKYNDDLEIIFDESAYEEIIENEEPQIDIKDIPSKLNEIYDDNGIDDDIDIDDDNEKNLNMINQNINVIDFDNENEIYEINNDKKKKTNKNIINENNIKFKSKHKKKRKKNINIYLDLNDDKIANLILEKRKEIKYKFPNNIFKISVIKDIKINIISQIALEEFFKEKNKKNLKEIIFDPNYKYFGVSWTNEINRNFISISCFA